MGRPRKAPEGTGYVKAKEAFGGEYEGEMITVTAGEIVPVGHPLLKGREDLFEPVTHFGRWDKPAEASADEPDDEPEADEE